ncbi:hypothetical protein F5050DRAFT_1581892 [Lentinula boryana]|uniref:Reverse transcriptase RNase H-like domain-containing protein n=1 Tax=Lentinula boryana TaxID=40481 RepID=A0ABQ8PXN1_9AGAR|nr:hypothetical protein F5050DRAFT_1581892 [Lentinula boryana]
MGINKIFLVTNASNFCYGSVLMYGPSLDTARPVTFDSLQFSGVKLNYPIHGKELFVIVGCLCK